MHCHLCQSMRVEIFSQERRDDQPYTVIWCQECAVIQTWERYDLVSPDYVSLPDAAMDPARVWCQSQHKAPAFIQWERVVAAGGVGPPAPLLDVGCGTGGFLRYAFSRGWEPFGFDSSKAQAEYARQQFPHVHQATSAADYLAQLSIDPPLFGVITLWDVFEHIRNPGEFIAGLRPLLAPDGLMFITVPSGGALPWKKRLYRMLGRSFSVDPWEHVFYYTPASLAHHLRGWEMEILATGGMTCYPRPWSLFEMARRGGFALLRHLPSLAPQIYILARNKPDLK